MKNRWLAPALVGVLIFGAALRIVRLHSAPPGLFFDEAANLFDIADVLNGARPLYFPANNGREPFFFYWASLFASFLGNTPYSLRLSGATIGTLTLPATFLCAREAARCWDRDRTWGDAVAVVSTFVLGITYFHLHYSRFGLRTISLPFFLALGYGFLFRAIRRRSVGAATAAGVFGGLSTYTYIASRLAPLVLIVPFVFGVARGRLRPLIPLVVWVGLLWALVSVPLGVYYLRHPQSVQGHTDDVSILNPVNNGGDPVGAVLRGAIATLGAFDVRGSLGSDQNLSGRPILDPLMSVFFAIGLVGVIASFARKGQPKTTLDGMGTEGLDLDRSRFGTTRASDESLRPFVAAFLIAWIVDQSAPSVFSVSPPGFVRLTGVLPAVAIIVGIGICTSYRWLRLRKVPRASVLAGIGAALAISTGWTVRDYFFVWAPSRDAYNWMMAPKVDAANYLKPLAASDRVFLAPLWAGDNTVKFMTRGAPIQSFDLGQTLVVPTDRSRDVDYLFPASDPEEATQVASELPSHPPITTVNDPSGRYPTLLRLDLHSANLPEVPRAAATFEDGIGLVGATISPSKIVPGASIDVTFEWFSQHPSSDDYTIFVHVRDSADSTVAQADGRPGNGSFPTTSWRPGDIIWDHHHLTVGPTVRTGSYHVVVGLYRLATLKRLQATTSFGRAANDEVVVGNFEVRSP